MTYYRRNIDCLTSSQLHDLREALAVLYELPEASPVGFARIAGIHGSPPPAWCIHGTPGFLTWHRAYLPELESALHQLNPSVHVPFWDWSSRATTGVPDACSSSTYVNRDGDTVPNPLYAGPRPGGGTTARRSDIDTTTFGDLATSAQNALNNADFGPFQNALNGVHGGVHVRVGGDMSSVAQAGFDPIFYLHHANVDRLWAQWQATHPGSLPPVEASLTLEPFRPPCAGGYYAGSDMESVQALGYGYSNLCILVLGPFVLEVIRMKLPPWTRRRLDVAKLVLRATRMQQASAEIRAFVGTPDADEDTALEDNPLFAGTLGIFGMGSPHRKKGEEPAEPMAMRGERFDLQLDVTKALRAALEQEKEPTLSLVVVDSEGRRVERGLDLDGVELHVG